MNLWDRLPKELQKIILERKEAIEHREKVENIFKEFNYSQWGDYELQEKFRKLDGNNGLEMVSDLVEEPTLDNILAEIESKLSKEYYEKIFERNPNIYQIPKELKKFFDLYKGFILPKYPVIGYTGRKYDRLFTLMFYQNYLAYMGSYGCMPDNNDFEIETDIKDLVIQDWFDLLFTFNFDHNFLLINLNTESPYYGQIIFLNPGPSKNNKDTFKTTFIANSFIEFIENFDTFMPMIKNHDDW